MVTNKPKLKPTGRELTQPSAKHRLRFDPFAVFNKPAVRKGPPKPSGMATAKPESSSRAPVGGMPWTPAGPSTSVSRPSASSTSRPSATSTAFVARPALSRPSMVIDMTNLSIGTGRPSIYQENVAQEIKKVAVEETRMDVDSESRTTSSLSSSSSFGSGSDSDCSSGSKSLGETSDRERLTDRSEDKRTEPLEATAKSKKLFKFRTSKYYGPVVRQWPVHRTKYTFDYEPEDASSRTAHCTMQGILADRNNNITRQILFRGDTPSNKYVVGNSVRRSNTSLMRTIQWPAVDIRRYMDHIKLNRHLPMGVDPMRSCRDQYIDIGLEEPGAEWDQRLVDFMAGGTAEGASDNAAAEDEGFVHGFSASADESAISDSARNGGMGIVIKRREHTSTTGLIHTGEDVQFMTYLQIKHPELSKPRIARMPLLDAFAGRAPDVISNHYQPVVELTRTQVIDQVLRAASKANGVPTPQLSQFASCSVAEEAVSGVSRIWDKMSEFWKYRLNTGCHTSNDKRRVLMPFPGSARTGWISVLEAAILSDIPPEVIARCYHRLTKLCDVPTAKEENYLCQIYADSLVRARRQYVSRKESSEST